VISIPAHDRIGRRLAVGLAALAILGAPTGAQAAAGTTPATTPASTVGGVVAPGPGPAGATSPTSTTPGPAGATSPATAAPTPTVSMPAPSSSPATEGSAAITPTAHLTPKAKGSGKISDAALAAAILAGLIALACLVWGVFRFGAFEPHWLLSLRHSLAEGGFRSSATWAEFSDWLRLGR
jgi:hypothetical protein